MARKAIVTGSDSGIGAATAIRLARDGFDVGVTWHSDRDGAEGTAREVREQGQDAVVTQLDVTNFEDAADTVEVLTRELGGLDVFVNNAGGGVTKSFLEVSLDDWQQVIDLNLTAAFVCAQCAARIMIAAGTKGRIVNVTSVHEHIPLPEAAAYCAAKGGLGLLTKVMALELGDHGITVNAIAPGEVSTPMTGQEDVDPHEQERPGSPLRRPGDAREIAALIAFVCRDEAEFLTGESIVIDGGLSLMAAQQDRQAP
jgi:NAD(P)-dependent dehydrogenase (short-subunit alcohol dehydrogenase family)